MIMPRGSDQLLLPVNPFFIALTLLAVVLLEMLPSGRHPAAPDLLALVLEPLTVQMPPRPDPPFLAKPAARSAPRASGAGRPGVPASGQELSR